jgi:hypothetical protein
VLQILRSWGLLAGYAAAASNLKVDLGRDPSPVEVNEFMLERARQYPFCAFALLEMRMAAVAKLMRNAESKGNHGEAVEYFYHVNSITSLIDSWRCSFGRLGAHLGSKTRMGCIQFAKRMYCKQQLVESYMHLCGLFDGYWYYPCN